MLRIKCSNPNCAAGAFDWDELTELESPHDLAKPGEKNAVRVVAYCRTCGTGNTVWVKRSGLRTSPLFRDVEPGSGEDAE